MSGRQDLLTIEKPVGIDVRTPAGIARIETLFEEQNISPDVAPDSNLESVWLSGGLYTFLATGDETFGQYALFDFYVPPKAGPPAHIHNREDEAFYVVDGEMTFQVNNEVFTGGPGTLVPYTRGDLHAFQNLSAEPARLLVLAAPAGIENLFREGGQPGTDPSTPPPPDVAKFLAVVGKYEIEVYPETTLFQQPITQDGGITLLGDDRSETILGSNGSDLIIGRQGNDQVYGDLGNDLLVGGTDNDYIDGGEGNDLISGSEGHDTLIGGGAQDKFLVCRGQGTDTIADFGGVGVGGTNPSTNAIAEVDTLQFEGPGLTARNMLLNQDGRDLLITFEEVEETGIILQDFALENLENLSEATGASADIGNILFDGQTTITDSFDVFNANQQRRRVFNQNSVTFLNDLDNNTQGFNHSNDVINGQGGNDILYGLSGDDLLRGYEGDDTLDGGAGDDHLLGGAGADLFVLKQRGGLDSISDFENGIDIILLDGLTFGELTITQSESDTLLSLSNSNQSLAILSKVESSTITRADFSIV